MLLPGAPSELTPRPRRSEDVRVRVDERNRRLTDVRVVAAVLAPEAMPTATARPHPHSHACPKHRTRQRECRAGTSARLSAASNLNPVGSYPGELEARRERPYNIIICGGGCRVGGGGRTLRLPQIPA